jgi:hypothetical protein
MKPTSPRASEFSQTTEWDDPVPSNSDWNWEFPVSPPHAVESQVRSALMELKDVQFPSLVVRRTENGVCLQGVMQVADEVPDVAEVARKACGVSSVLNQLLVQTLDAQPV